MTASQRSSAGSENSVSQLANDRIHPSAHDPKLVRITRCANNVDPNQLTGEQRMRVYIGVTQSCLEALDEHGVAQYDDRSKQIKPTDAMHALAQGRRCSTAECYTPAEDPANHLAKVQ